MVGSTAPAHPPHRGCAGSARCANPLRLRSHPICKGPPFTPTRPAARLLWRWNSTGVMSFERVAKYLKSHKKDLDVWQAKDELPVLTTWQNCSATFRGSGLESASAKSNRARSSSTSHPTLLLPPPSRKPLLLQVLAQKGALIEDLQSWTVATKGDEISLTGTLSASGWWRLLSQLSIHRFLKTVWSSFEVPPR